MLPGVGTGINHGAKHNHVWGYALIEHPLEKAQSLFHLLLLGALADDGAVVEHIRCVAVIFDVQQNATACLPSPSVANAIHVIDR